jgi:hypothetical protein
MTALFAATSGVPGFLRQGASETKHHPTRRGASAANLETTAMKMASALRHRGPDASGMWVETAAADLLAQHLVGAISANAARREPLRLALVVAMASRRLGDSAVLRADTLLEASRSVLEQTR